MRKHLMAVAAAFILVFAVSGCSGSGQGDEASDDGASGAEIDTSALFVSADWPQSEATEGVPEPRFSVDAAASSESDLTFSIVYENVPAAEVEAYVEEAKAAGYTYSASEKNSSSEYSYYALNSGNIFESSSLGIVYNKSDGTLEISVGNFAAIEE